MRASAQGARYPRSAEEGAACKKAISSQFEARHVEQAER